MVGTSLRQTANKVVKVLGHEENLTTQTTEGKGKSVL